MHILGKIFHSILLTIFALALTGVTIFMFASSYELVTNDDLPYIKSIQIYSQSEAINSLHTQGANNTNTDQIAAIYQLERIRSSQPKFHIELVAGISQNEVWYERLGKAHYVVLDESSQAGIGNTLVYLTKGWRTFVDVSQIQEGSTFYIDAKNFYNMYRVIEISTKQSTDYYMLDHLDVPYVVLAISDPQTQAVTYIKALFISHNKRV